MNPLQTNCYVLINDNKGIIFDPSVDNGNNIDRILKKCENIDIEAIVLTHGHYDHISGVKECLKHFPVKVYIHDLDRPFLTDNALNCALHLDPNFTWDIETQSLFEEKQTIGSFEFDVVLTPGHTPGHVSLFYQDAVFSGDVLFRLSMGRTDLPGGNERMMRKSLDYFNSLEDDYTIYCGHGSTTTLAFEKRFNPYLKGVY